MAYIHLVSCGPSKVNAERCFDLPQSLCQGRRTSAASTTRLREMQSPAVQFKKKNYISE